MKKLIAIIAFLSIGLSTFAMDYCDWFSVYTYDQQEAPYMGNKNGGENNKNMFDWMWKNRIPIMDDVYSLYPVNGQYSVGGRVFLAINGYSVGEVVDPTNMYFNNIELYYTTLSGVKKIRTIDLNDYRSDELGIVDISMVSLDHKITGINAVVFNK